MTYREEVRDLFSVSDDYYLAHCISADFGMGKGIAVEFNKRFNMKGKLKYKYPDYLSRYINDGIGGDCILEDRVLKLKTCSQVEVLKWFADEWEKRKNE